tara:strand:- start:94 stop:477 length:384 start_codon:yes stop_codon:yes gene_type:complete
MSKKTLKDLNVDAHIAVLHTKVDALLEKQKELTGRVRANEKVVAAIGLLGSIALAVIGAGYFAPSAEAHMGHDFPTDEWIEKLRDHESKRNRTSIDDMLNSSLAEYENGSNDPTEQEELLQLPSSLD